MNILVLIGIIGTIAFSCSSDCLQCHPKLKPMEYNKKNKYYKEHHFLITCTKCHPNHSSKGMDKCGADCFECHSRQKLVQSGIPEHQKLKTCTKCHRSLEFENMNNFPVSGNPSWENKLKETSLRSK